jgi:protein arginine kinase activator
LCTVCAEENGAMNLFQVPNFTFHNLLAGFFDPETMFPSSGRVTTKVPVRCPNCGLSFSDFRRLGHLGCNECYETFDNQIEPMLRRLHGSTEHVGKKLNANVDPKADKHLTIKKLEEELQQAVSQEAYEKAAQIRDQIRELKNEL